MLEHELRELLPLMERAPFSKIEMGSAEFRILGLSVVGFVRGRAEKA